MDIEKAIEFILNQQARTDAAFQALAEESKRLMESHHELAQSHRELAQSHHELAHNHSALADLVRSIGENQLVLTKNQEVLTQNQIHLMNGQDRTDQRLESLAGELGLLAQRLNSLTSALEQWLRRGGDGSRPE